MRRSGELTFRVLLKVGSGTYLTDAFELLVASPSARLASVELVRRGWRHAPL